MASTHIYPTAVAKLIDLEDTKWDDVKWLDYVNQFGLTKADLPELNRLSWDEDLLDDDHKSISYGIHALRASIQIDPETGIKLYLEQLQKFPDDDWLHEEIDGISRNAGANAINPFIKVLTDATQDERLRVTFANGLEQIANTYPELRDISVKGLMGELQNYHVQDGDYLNSVLVSNLIQLKAVEAINLIEEVFKNRDLDEWSTGSWPAAQVSLGLKKESDFSPEELKPKPSDKILAIREMIDNLSKLRDIEEQKNRSPISKKPAAKGFGSSKKGGSPNKKKKR